MSAMELPLTAEDEVSVELSNLSIFAGGNALLDDVSVNIKAGKITLIVGCSGVGKSLLLRAIAGLLDTSSSVRLQGDISVNAEPAKSGNRQVGVVFQHFALLDELTPAENVRIARDHCADRKGRRPTTDPKELLAELQVPSGRHTGVLSGGQRQRLAIARALAFDAPILVYDEPTSGLDSTNASKVARRIRSTNNSHQKTSIVVTHDFQSLLPIADEVLLLDAQSRSLTLVPRQQWGSLSKMLVVPPREEEEESGKRGLANRVVEKIANFLVLTSRVAEEVVTFPMRLVPAWRSPFWGLKFLTHYLRLIAGPTACLYLLITGMIIGFVATYFTFRFLPYANYTKPLLIEDLLQSIGFSLYRVLIPLLASLLIAARCGAAVASDVGAKCYGKQLDAMRSLSVSPQRYLLSPILYSFLVGVPVLTVLSFLAAAFTSMVVFEVSHPGLGLEYWNLHFHRQLVDPGEFFYDGWQWMFGKQLLCAAGIGLIAYRQGSRPKLSSSAVSQCITSTILWGTLFVLGVHFVVAFFEY